MKSENMTKRLRGEQRDRDDDDDGDDGGGRGDQGREAQKWA